MFFDSLNQERNQERNQVLYQAINQGENRTSGADRFKVTFYLQNSMTIHPKTAIMRNIMIFQPSICVI